MTNNEAIELLDKLLDKMLVDSYRNSLFQNKEKLDTENALEIAITVIKKQIPVTPFPDNRYYGNGKCPNCHAVFMDKLTKYCGNCGQALDWSDEKWNK